MKERGSKETVQSVENALKLLECFTKVEDMGITEIALMMDVGKATASRLVFSLQKYGYLQQDEVTKKYRLGMKLMYMGTLVKERNELVYLMDPYMKELAYRYQLCAHLVVLEEYQAKFIHKIVAGPFMSMRSHVGVMLPAYGTATGKCLLAHASYRDIDAYFKNVELKPMTQETIVDRETLRGELEQIRARGYSEDRGESDVGLYCIAVPIANEYGNVIAAMSLSGLKETVVGQKSEIIRELTRVASKVCRKV